MKIILLHDVPKIGRKYDMKTVSDGHALNLLIPKGLAEIATPKAVARVEKLKSEDKTREKIQDDLISMNLKAIESVSLEMKEKANEKGHLFASIHKEEIIARVKAEKHIDLLPEFLMLEKPIKEVGKYVIDVKVKDKSAKLKLEVSSL